VSEPVSKARRQALLWTRQNWGVLALTTLAGLLLFVNLMVVIAVLPQFGRSFLGIEGDFARLGARIVNLTTTAVAAALTFLVIDPLLDAVYVLRCFYGESLATGEDLRAAFQRVVALIVLVIVMLGVAPARATAQSVDPVRLDRSIDEVIHRREFTWRAPRPPGAEPQGRWVGWARKVQDMAADLWDWAIRKIREWFESKQGNEGDGKDPPAMRRMLEILLGVAVALATGAAVFFFLRKRVPLVAAEAVTVAGPMVNLHDESVTADQLPESSWLKLAEEWLAKGDCRLALRALYLAGLNYLGERGVVSIRRWKSGLDYKRELERRGRAKPEMGVVFTRNVDLFERGWYGRHAVDRGMVEAFVEGMSEIRGYVDGG
jgi:hypothetical protein